MPEAMILPAGAEALPCGHDLTELQDRSTVVRTVRASGWTLDPDGKGTLLFDTGTDQVWWESDDHEAYECRVCDVPIELAEGVEVDFR